MKPEIILIVLIAVVGVAGITLAVAGAFGGF